MLESFEGSRTEFMRMLADHDSAPAFVQRAERVEAAWAGVLRRGEKEQQELLGMPKLRLATLAAMVECEWSRLSAILAADDIRNLRHLHEIWEPQLRAPVAPNASSGKLRAAIRDLRQSFERFNRRWQAQVRQIDLSAVNYEREQYNQYYLIEKAAAFGSDRLAELGFEPLQKLTHDDVLSALPCLRVPA